MRYLLNSAVLTGFGRYEYEQSTRQDLAAWLRRPGWWESRIGYAETADAIERWTGIRPPLSREASPMAPGDEAMVVRLRYRVADPTQKGRQAPSDEEWELGWLRVLDSEHEALLLCRRAVEATQAFLTCGQQPTLDPGGSGEYRAARQAMARAHAAAVLALTKE